MVEQVSGQDGIGVWNYAYGFEVDNRKGSSREGYNGRRNLPFREYIRGVGRLFDLSGISILWERM